MNKTVLSIGIICLLIGVSVVSSTDNITDKRPARNQSLKTVNNQKVMSACDHEAYVGGSGGFCSLYEFNLKDPGNLLNCICPPGPDRYFFGSIAWAPNGRLYGCEYNSGGLWVIDLEDCSMEQIGGGGTSLNSLAWNPINNKLYGASSTGLYEYDIDTGDQEFIGSFGTSGKTIIGLAIDSEGRGFIWDVLFSGSSTLWEVNLSTAKATEIGPLGLTLLYAQGGDFCKEDDILYLATYTTNPYVGYFLYECDVETGSCSLIGEFHEYAEVSMFAIPYNPPSVTTISFDPPEPDGENGWYVSDVNVTLNATDNDGVKTIYYKIPGDDWKNHSGDSITILLDHDCLTGLIEFYSVDNAGNQEEIKSADIKIDQLPPDIQLWYEVMGGNPLKGWDIEITAYVTDNCSGVNGDRIEFFLNGGFQSVVSGSGPTYTWSFKYYGDLDITIGVYCCDIAGNCAYFEIPIKSSRNIFQLLIHPLFFQLLERFPLLHRLFNFIK